MLKVLLVEDNPMVMDLLREALTPLANVVAVGDAAEALLQTVESPPDLIISDFHLPGMDGSQLLEKLRGRKSSANIPVILMATKAEIVDRLKPLEEQVADFIAKPFFIKDAVLRIKRVLDRIKLEKLTQESTGSGSKVRGSLAQMNVIDLLQSLEMGRKSCALSLASGDERSVLFFSDGQINDAKYGTVTGDEAVYKTLRWGDSGQFEIDFSSTSPAQTTTRSTQGLLMEGLRLLDEASRDSE